MIQITEALSCKVHEYTIASEPVDLKDHESHGLPRGIDLRLY